MGITKIDGYRQLEFTGDLSMMDRDTTTMRKIVNLADPTAAQHAATKQYVDNVAAGLDVKKSVDVATTAALTVTYNGTSGTNGVGRLTGATNAIDGVTLVVGDRILVKDQSSGTHASNGLWEVKTLGTGDNGTWDRPSDFDNTPGNEVTAGAFTFIERGTSNKDRGFVLITDDPITLDGTAGTALAWTQFSAASVSSFVTREVPTGSVNGTNADFTVANSTIVTGSEEVFLNGLIQNDSGNDYSIASDVITFTSAPVNGDVILVNYRYNA